ncbi:SCO family protein [Burkholderia sp. PU8-34]
MNSQALSNQPVGGNFDLIDHNGQCVSQSTYIGKFTLFFFGFTNCRVVCPRALTRISSALDSLGDLANSIQPLYVSVDPERDTPEVMKAFLADRFPRFTGLTGDIEQVNAIKKAFRVYAQKAKAPDEPDGYTVPHTALTYLLDVNGDYLAHFPEAIEASELADRIRKVTLAT